MNTMQIQVNTDDNIEGGQGLSAQVEAAVEKSLGRYRGQITRVAVHLADENSEKGGDADKRCMMEARLEGRPPTAVTNHAPTLELAIVGAADKLLKVIESTIGRLRGY